jgi:peptidoglycan/LPS O-acetylase OafA/YrhL
VEYRREIDGLRALAVVPVILFHAGFGWVRGGYVGVDVFFVISGYLITSIIVSEKNAGRFTLRGFYERRARRILPALFLVTIACIIPAWFWMLSNQLKLFAESALAVALFTSNILFWRKSDYFAPAVEDMPLLHTWTLAVEEQFYVVFPLFVLMIWKLGHRWLVGAIALVAVLSFAIAEYTSHTHPSAAFYFSQMRAWELMLGALAAFAWMDKRVPDLPGDAVAQLLALAGLLLIAVAVFAYGPYTPYPGLYTLAPTLGTVLVVLFATPRTLVGKLLSQPPLVGIGLISYSAYLWHQPLFAFARIRSLHAPGVWTMSALILAAFVLAYLTWRFVETPFRNRANFTRPQIFSGAAVVTASLVAIGTVGVSAKGFQDRMPAAALAELNVLDYHEARIEGACNVASGFRPPEEACLLGDRSAAPHIAIWGDSHAEMESEALGDALARIGKSALQLTADACFPFTGVRTAGLSANVDCIRQTAAVKKFLLERRDIETVIFAPRWTAYLVKEKFDNGEGGAFDDRMYGEPTAPFDGDAGRRKGIVAAINREVKEFLNAGKRIVLVYPVPEVGWPVPDMAAKQIFLTGKPADDISTDYSVQKKRNAPATAVLDALGDHPNILRVRPDRILCDTFIKGRCIAHLNGVPLYYDSQHLTNAGARLIAAKIARELR